MRGNQLMSPGRVMNTIAQNIHLAKLPPAAGLRERGRVRVELGAHEPLILRDTLRALAILPRLAAAHAKADLGPGER